MSSEAQKRAWTKYNKSPKRKAAHRRYYLSHTEEMLKKCREWKENNPEKVKEYQRRNRRKRTLNGKAKITQINLDPKKARAVDLVYEAVKAGKIKRKLRCEMCFKKVSLHRHHEDYDKPLDIIWLCPKCHKERHRQLNEIFME